MVPTRSLKLIMVKIVAAPYSTLEREINRECTVAEYLTTVTDPNLRKTLTTYRLSVLRCVNEDPKANQLKQSFFNYQT